jgi:hypothetical protein
MEIMVHQLYSSYLIESGNELNAILKGKNKFYGSKLSLTFSQSVAFHLSLIYFITVISAFVSGLQALLRVYKLVEFGHFLASIPDTGVSYDSKQKLFSIASETDGDPGEMSEEKIKETAATNVSVAFLFI